MKIFCFLFILMMLLSLQVESQTHRKKSSSGKKKKAKPVFVDLHAGMGAGEIQRTSFYGPFIGGGFRKTSIILSKHFNFSFDVHAGSQIAFMYDREIEQKSVGGYPYVSLCYNFNAGTGTYPPNKKKALSVPIGGFLGPGIYIVQSGRSSSNSATGYYQETQQRNSVADFGPMVNFGFRIRLSKVYFMELKIFGAYTVFNELAVGGGGLYFPLNLKKAAGSR